MTEYTKDGALTRSISLDEPNEIWQHAREPLLTIVERVLTRNQ